MPITLGDPISSTPPWNKYILVLLWLAQIFFSFFLWVSMFVYMFLGLLFNGGSSVLFCIVAANTLAIIAIGHEVYMFNVGTLTVRKYYRYELAKAGYCAGILFIAFLNGVWSSAAFVVPFWSALWYATKLRKEEEGVFWREITEVW